MGNLRERCAGEGEELRVENHFQLVKEQFHVESLPEGIDKIQIGSGVYNVKSYAEVGKPYGAIYAKTFKRDAEGTSFVSSTGRRKKDRTMNI